MAKVKAGGSREQKLAMSKNIRLQQQLAIHNGCGIEDFKKSPPLGMKIGVKTVKTKLTDGKGGFIRVIAIKPLEEVLRKPVEQTEGDVPF